MPDIGAPAIECAATDCTGATPGHSTRRAWPPLTPIMKPIGTAACKLKAHSASNANQRRRDGLFKRARSKTLIPVAPSRAGQTRPTVSMQAHQSTRDIPGRCSCWFYINSVAGSQVRQHDPCQTAAVPCRPSLRVRTDKIHDLGRSDSGYDPPAVLNEPGASGFRKLCQVSALGSEALPGRECQSRVIAGQDAVREHALDALHQIVAKERVHHMAQGLGNEATGQIGVDLHGLVDHGNVTERKPAAGIVNPDDALV